MKALENPGIVTIKNEGPEKALKFDIGRIRIRSRHRNADGSGSAV